MDFDTLLTVAQKNGGKQSIACYQTKFAPPKKQSKQSRTLSDNIKKFLARKEEEEKQKVLEEKKKKHNLLALRDHKAQSRINKHLKVCKAANKSVLADAVDNENTAITIAGPSQPDEDDYGYVSQEASAFYNQLMSKYNNLPPEKPLFSNSGKKTVKDIASTKDRVKQALKQQEIDEALRYRGRRKSSSLSTKGAEHEEKNDKNPIEKEQEQEKVDKPKPRKKKMPLPMDFGELLKLAEKKQHEPVVLEVKPKGEEPERLMTKKQMKEYAKEKEWQERKEQRDRNIDETKKSTISNPVNNKQHKPQIGKNLKSIGKTTNSLPINSNKPELNLVKKNSDKSSDKGSATSKFEVAKNAGKDDLWEERKKLEAEKRKLEEMRRAIEEEKKKLAQSKHKQDESKSQIKPASKYNSAQKSLDKLSLTKDAKYKQSSNMGPSINSHQLPISDSRPKQFPPPDLKPSRSKQTVAKEMRKVMALKRRRICDEEEYDSELDDFIDDGPEEHSEDYSKYISEIFGYDKSKYRDVDDEDDTGMESNFAQQLKEEYVSTKIGIMEDLEDIRMEALEKKRKALLKKKIKK